MQARWHSPARNRLAEQQSVQDLDVDSERSPRPSAPRAGARRSRLRDAWRRWLEHPRLGLRVGLLAVLLSSPCLFFGFYLDEYTARFIYTDLPGFATTLWGPLRQASASRR